MKTRTQRLSILPLLAVLALPCVSTSAWGQDDAAQRALQRAESLLRDKQFRKAAAEFERASDLAGGQCPDCLLGVARAYRGGGQIDAALEVTRMALPQISEPGERAKAYDQLGSLLALKGEMDAARIAFQKAVELDAGMGAQVRSSLAAALLQRSADREAANKPNAVAVEVEINRGPGGR